MAICAIDKSRAQLQNVYLTERNGKERHQKSVASEMLADDDESEEEAVE